MNDLLAQVPCLLLVTDLDGRVHAASSGLAALMGFTQTQAVTLTLDDWLPVAGRLFMQTHVWPTLLKQGELLEGYLNLRPTPHRRERGPVPVMFNAHVKTVDGQARCYWVFFEVQSRSRFEAELIAAREHAQALSEQLARANAALEAANRALEQKAASIEASNHLLAQLSETDALTNVGNRRALKAAFEAWQREWVTGSAAETARATLLLVDADHFKQVNDTWGHDEGDRVLVALAHSLRACVRSTDHISRFGGEEFVVWLPQAGADLGHRVAQDIHQHVRRIDVGPNAQRLTVSIGLVTLNGPAAGTDLEQWLRHADQAVYQAKAQGRDQTVLADTA